MNISALWDTLVDAICRPPRDRYQIGELVGGRRGYCKLSGKTIVREDLVLVNKKGQKLQCSHYKPSGTTAEHGLPIVIYCHCNSGSRRDAEEAFYVLLPHNITVFCLDFAGSGMSDGDWVTLGAHEVDDLEVAVKNLRESYPMSTIGLWGRSMGAVTALIYSARDPSIAGVVMDSPFARLTELMVELVDEQKLPIPKAFMKVALGMMQRSVRKRAGFNIDSVSPLDVVSHCFIPALFGHATEDTFVSKTHSQRLHAAYASTDKSFVTFKGDHNSVRPQSFYSSVLMFLHTALRCPDNPTNTPFNTRAGKPPALCADSCLKGTDGKEENQGEAMIHADASNKEYVSPTRELSPPWNREQARTNTEHQLRLLSDGLAKTASGERSTAKCPDPCHSDAHDAQETSEDGAASLSMHWLDADQPLEPPTNVERAPWLKVDPDAAPARLQASREAAQREKEAAEIAKAAEEAARCPETGGKGHNRDPSAMSVEDRFWHLQIDDEDSMLNSDDEEALLARALEESLREASRQAQRHSVVATSHAGRETRLNELIPDSMRNISQEDAEEMMLVEAIKASLLEADEKGLEPSPPATSPLPPPANPGRSPSIDSASGASGTKEGKPKTRGMFWRKKDSPSVARRASTPSRQHA